MPGTVWTPVAESDLDDILFYISLVDRRPRQANASIMRFVTVSQTTLPSSYQARNIHTHQRVGST